MNSESEKYIRRVAGYHDIRLDGLQDILSRAAGKSVFDIGCNRGHVGWDLANAGATLVHGCDHFAEGIETARQNFADRRNVESQFECADLSKGPRVLNVFGARRYDIVLMLATYHKLKRVMSESALIELMEHFAGRTAGWFLWRGTSEKANDNELEILAIDRVFRRKGLKQMHRSGFSLTLGVAVAWRRD